MNSKTLSTQLDAGGDPNTVDGNGLPLIAIATKNNDLSSLRLLIRHKASLVFPTNKSENKSLIHWAIIRSTDPDVFVELLKASRLSTDELSTNLRVAAFQNRTDAVSMLIRAGALVNGAGVRGVTAMHLTNSLSVMNELISHGANVNVKTVDGQTPLHIACEKGRDKLVVVLLRAGASVNTVDTEGNAPLHSVALGYLLYADDSSYCSCARLLLLNGANSGAKNKKGLLASELIHGSGESNLKTLIVDTSNKFMKR